jgi:glycosyltransferase involved in cell wall biosynthesis
MVNFLGFLDKDKVQEFLEISHIFIMPSFPETLGRAFLEASASNCLIVGHLNTGVDGIFTNRESAIFVNEDTIHEEIFELFKNFSKEKYGSITSNALKIVKNLSWTKIGESYNQVFSSCIRQK